MRNANGAGTCFRLKGRRRHPYIARAFLGWKEVIRTLLTTKFRTKARIPKKLLKYNAPRTGKGM